MFITLKESNIRLLDEFITFDLTLGNNMCSFFALIDPAVSLKMIFQYIQITVKCYKIHSH